MNIGAKVSGGLDLNIGMIHSAGKASNISEDTIKSPETRSVQTNNKSSGSQSGNTDPQINNGSESETHYYTLE
ncbi:MAG TPA: hypothetical protein VKO63_06135 [Chitinispirillaceae bacterium]|nr:hypothetical protein [Chitinispirillaceae bacterium]